MEELRTAFLTTYYGTVSMEENKDMMRKQNRESKIVWYAYLVFTVVAFVVLWRIVDIKLFFRDSDPYLKYYTARSSKVKLAPVRGNILSSDGRLLAISTPMYQIYMDCAVRKSEFAAMAPEKGKKREAEWKGEARELAGGLSAIYGKSADYWSTYILDGRRRGARHAKIGGPIDHETLQKVKALPLFSKGANKGGIIVERIDTRQYPYGSLARRTIGYVKDNSRSNGNNAIGLEGSFDYVLHGTEGYEWTRKTDRKRIVNRDSSLVAAEDGRDIRTTLNIDIQDIADNALRTNIADAENVEGGCVVVMDVKTGAIRAMVNLLRDSTSGRLGEVYNMAVGRAGEPGSVFKTATLMSLLEDNMVRMSDSIPTNHGRLKYFKPDDHIPSFEKRNHTDMISIQKGYEMSSNYVFRKLAMDHYGDNPKRFLDNIYLYKLGEAYNFDLKGFVTPVLPSSDVKSWSATDLGSLAIGYSISETPLHILTFYNAIANKGRMMKPYLVEDIEVDGMVKEKRGPSVLNGSICSRATADSLTKGLAKITEEGTAWRLKNARLKVAGKTGTARIIQDGRNAMRGNPYCDKLGRTQYQATFVGFFPVEQPKYSIIVVLYSKPLPRGANFYGGTLPAMVCKDVVDKTYALDTDYGEFLESRGRMPDMSVDEPETSRNGKVPGVRGLGLMDAIYAIENDGYRCVYSGVGHVVAQSPAAGTKLHEGGTVTIQLK